MQKKVLFNNGELAWETRAFPVSTDFTGSLGVVETGSDIGFNVNRVFFLRDIDSTAVRGMHSHAELKQLIICLSGSFEITLDCLKEKEAFTMTSNDFSLYLDGKVWRTMTKFSQDAVVLVLCDKEYELDHVVRDYDEFKKIMLASDEE